MSQLLSRETETKAMGGMTSGPRPGVVRFMRTVEDISGQPCRV